MIDKKSEGGVSVELQMYINQRYLNVQRRHGKKKRVGLTNSKRQGTSAWSRITMKGYLRRKVFHDVAAPASVTLMDPP